MESKKISTEDDLLAHYLKNFTNVKEWHFPKVHTISTLSITPDIDLLFINKRLNLVVGYEFKVLKYYKNWKRVNYNPMYSGIGEALLYFQHGIDKCYLVLGLTDMPSDLIDVTLEKIDQAIKSLNILTNLFTTWLKKINELEKIDITTGIFKREKLPSNMDEPWGLGCFGIMVWTERDGLRVKKNADQRFPVDKNSDLIHKKECLLRKEFKYKKSFLDKVTPKT